MNSDSNSGIPTTQAASDKGRGKTIVILVGITAVIGGLLTFTIQNRSDPTQARPKVSPQVVVVQNKPADGEAGNIVAEPDTGSAALSANDGPDEITAVTVCDLAVKSSLLSEDSFDPHGNWLFFTEGSSAVVRRKFNSNNAFGAHLTSQYECKWDAKTDSIESLLVRQPNGEVVRLK